MRQFQLWVFDNHWRMVGFFATQAEAEAAFEKKWRHTDVTGWRIVGVQVLAGE